MSGIWAWWRGSPSRQAAAGVLACGIAAALFLAPSLWAGALGPADLLFSMTPWQLYRDLVPSLHGVHNPQLDVIQQYYPWRVFIAECLRHNQIPYWNPHTYCGQPFLGNVLSAVFYPFGVLGLVLSVGRFYLLSAWFHLTLLGGGMWLLLRAHHLRWQGALTSALAVMFSPFVVGWLHYAPVSQWTFAWAPLLCYLWLRAWRRHKSHLLAWPALVLSCSLLGGHLQISVYVGLAWFTYACGAVITERRWRDAPLYLGLPAALSLGVAAAQVTAALELSALSGRQTTTYAATAAEAMPFRALIGLLAPWFFGRNTLQWWGPGANAIEMSMGVGSAATLLGVAALVLSRKSERWWFAAIAALGLLLALRTPLYALLWHVLPGFSALKGLARALCLCSVGCSALAGFAVDALCSAEPVQVRHAKRLGVGLLAATVAALLAAWASEAQRSAPGVIGAFSAGISGYVLVQSAVALAAAAVVGHIVAWQSRKAANWLPLLVLAELFYLGVGQQTAAPSKAFFPSLPETEWLAGRAEPFRMVGQPAPGGPQPFLDWMPMNTPLAYGLSSPSGSESLSISAYRQLLQAFDEPGWEPQLDSPLLRLVGVRYILSRGDLEGRSGLRRIGGERLGIYERADALPLAFATSSWQTAPADAQLSQVVLPSFDPTVALVPPTADVPTPGAAGMLQPALTVRRHSPQRWSAGGSLAAPSVVLLTQVAAPGWQCWRNDQRAELFVADAVFLGTSAPAGQGLWRWVWRPISLRLGLFVSLISLSVLGGLAAFRRGP